MCNISSWICINLIYKHVNYIKLLFNRQLFTILHTILPVLLLFICHFLKLHGEPSLLCDHSDAPVAPRPSPNVHLDAAEAPMCPAAVGDSLGMCHIKGGRKKCDHIM